METVAHATNNVSLTNQDVVEKAAEVSIPPKTDDKEAHAEAVANIRTSTDPALRAAWNRFLQYDRAAFHQKQEHVRWRALVILLSFLSSLFAVAVASKADWFSTQVLSWFVVLIPICITSYVSYLRKKWPLRMRLGMILIGVFLAWIISLVIQTEIFVKGIPDLLQLLVFGFALAASGILAYATLFIPSELWAKYRFSAEMIRRNIYLYRMQAGPYLDLAAEKQQNKLIEEISAADEYSPTAVDADFPPISDKKPAELETAIKESVGESWFDTLPIETYIQERLWHQIDWYIGTSSTEYRQMKKLQVASIIIGLMSSFIVFKGYAPWVAVTTAAAVSVNMLTNLSMYGRTYAIYSKAANKLTRLHLTWKIASPTSHEDSAYAAEFVQNVEGVFEEEINLWIQQVEKSVAEIEQAFSHKLPQEAGTTKSDPKKE